MLSSKTKLAFIWRKYSNGSIRKRVLHRCFKICARFCFTHEKINFFAFFVWMLFAKKTGGWVNIQTKENVVPSKRHCTGVETSNSKCIKETIEASVEKSSIISNDCGSAIDLEQWPYCLMCILRFCSWAGNISFVIYLMYGSQKNWDISIIN